VDFVKLVFIDGRHRYADASNIGICILGRFFTSDVGCHGSLFGRWAVDDSLGFAAGGNVTQLEKEGDYIFMSDLYSEEETPTRLKISRQQFVALFDFWQEKVCKVKPKEVIITCENGEFSIETKD
jgi:hypothetical protein